MAYLRSIEERTTALVAFSGRDKVLSSNELCDARTPAHEQDPPTASVSLSENNTSAYGMNSPRRVADSNDTRKTTNQPNYDESKCNDDATQCVIYTSKT